MKLDIKLEGSEDLIRFFADMPKQFGVQVLGDMSQKAASVVRSEARRQMPIDGELGQVGKKAVIIKRDKLNKTIRQVTIGAGYLNLRGKTVSVGKIIRHMTAGRQNMRRSGRGSTGRVLSRGGDFIERAFFLKRSDAIQVMRRDFQKILQKRAIRQKGIKYSAS
jgi:hypothetical protein